VNTTIPRNWWKPEYGFFGQHYIQGDNSVHGYRPHRDQSLTERTKEEVDGIIHLCDIQSKMGKVHIYDLPCGYGRHSLELAKRGYKVTGLDINEIHLAEAEKLNVESRVTFLRHNMLDLLPSESTNVCINMFYSFGFFETDEENEQVLKNIYNGLRVGGMFLMHTDVNIPFVENGSYQFNETRNLSNNEKLIVTESYDPIRKRINGSWTISNVTKEYSVRVYSEQEFRDLCVKVGFKETFSYSGWKKEPYSPDSDLMIITARK